MTQSQAQPSTIMLAVTFIYGSEADSIRQALIECGLDAQKAQPLTNPLVWVVPVTLGRYLETLNRLQRHFTVESAQVF
jgi:hypothetical protein